MKYNIRILEVMMGSPF